MYVDDPKGFGECGRRAAHKGDSHPAESEWLAPSQLVQMDYPYVIRIDHDVIQINHVSPQRQFGCSGSARRGQ